MDESERLAEEYLKSLGIGLVVFEPDGNIPPDFTVGSSIAVEVRRLNQNRHQANGSIEGLEEVAIPLWHRMKKLLRSIGPSKDGESWFVGMDFRRPIGRWKPLEAALRKELNSFMGSPSRTRTTIQVVPNLEIDFFRAGKDHGTFFLLGASSDADSGGWVLSELAKNLRLCISEKERKIAPHRSKYAEWWLVLADHIDYGMDPEDREGFRTEVMPGIPHSFARIVFIDPRDFRRAFEV